MFISLEQATTSEIGFSTLQCCCYATQQVRSLDGTWHSSLKMNAQHVHAQRDQDGNEQLHDEEAKVMKQVCQTVWSWSECNLKVQVFCGSLVRSLLLSPIQPLIQTFSSKGTIVSIVQY